MATTSSNRLIINLGSQANDGTGDAIRAAFDKVNQNFETIFNVAGIGSGLLFTKLADAPRLLSANKMLVTDATGLTVTQMSIVGAQGIQVTVDQGQKRVLIDATVTNLVNDPNPVLSNNLSGGVVNRGINFADPVDDQDIATKKWIYDNFLNRDSNYQYISSTNPITGANVTSTIVEGSTLRHNIQIQPTGVNTASNAGKVITLFDSDGVSLKDFDVSVGAWRPSHVTRKDYVDTKISLQGIDTIDPETGQINPSFGQMTGPLYLSRDPREQDPGNVAATKAYVDSVGFPSRQNFYVSLNGSDARYDIPAYKRGRSFAWAFRTVNKAAQAALQYSKASEIKLGVYQRVITSNNYKTPVEILSIGPGTISGTYKISVTYTGGNGTDPFIERSIRPGQFLQGISTNAIGEILNVALEPASNVEEYYEVRLVDYADTFESPITPSDLAGEVTFTLFEPNLIEIPDFWIGYKFVVDSVAGGGVGEIIGFDLYYHPNGNIYNQVIVRMSEPLSSTNIISGDNWHVYSGYFSVGESLRYGQKYNKLEISILVESGEFNEQLPIRIGDNISVKGDEFRRTMIKPAYVRGTARCGISTSKWANIWFRRDTQIDGIIVTQLNTSTDYAALTTATPDGVTNDASTEVITFTLGSGTADPDWIKKVFIGAGGRGEIKAVLGNTFTVDIAENDNGIRRIDSAAPIAAGDWSIYEPYNFGYHYLRDASRPLNFLAGPNPGGYNFASKILLDNIEFIKSEVIGWIDQTYSGGFTYNVADFQRNTGLLVDAVAQDLLFSGTSQATFAGLLNWNRNGVQSAFAGGVTIASNAVTYIKELAQKVVQKDLTGTRYQSAVTQTTSGIGAATPAEASTIAADIDVILNIFLNGTADVQDTIIPNGLTKSSDPDVQNAHDLLQANKLYIQAEAIAFVEATKANGFTYDQNKYTQNFGFIVDAVSTDLLYGGNKQSVQLGTYYWNFDGSSSAIANELSQTVAAYNYIKSILPDIIQGTALAVTQQNTVPQVIIGYGPGDASAVTQAQAKIDVVTNITSNGPSVASAQSTLPLTRSTDPDIINGAILLSANRTFIIAETIAFVNNSFLTGFVYDRETCRRDIGLIVDALAFDLKNGDINSSINAADSYYAGNVQQVLQNELAQTVGAIGYINTLAQQLFDQTPITTLYGFVPQRIDTIIGEVGAKAQVTNLTTAMQGILNNDPAFNPPKYNDEMDIFLMNDATMLRYLGGNGHGGFMKVLDPEGQIKSKSPYTQTCSSFSQSIGRHRFAGGFFVDGFCGNLPLVTAAGTASPDTNGNLIYIPVTGVRRLPVFPTYFIHEGVKYEADYMQNYDPVNQTGTLVLNPNNPGGISSVSVNSGNTQNEFKPNVAQLPVTFSSPGTPGGATARGYAVTNASGNIQTIVITFPGVGYVTEPSVSLGGATFNFIIDGGAITSMSVNYGGIGYTTGTQINIASPGGAGLTATATITGVDGLGAITSINLVSGGTGYTSVPTVTFGRQVFSANLVNGFIGNLPSKLELITAGNRSMLANDFTQLNDLGYGIFATNGGFIENVSMFTYYCYTSYYALNGAILRTITGSTAYGTYGLVAEGSNPLEVPTAVTMSDELTQIATVYNQAPYINAKGGADIYVTLDSTYGYPPYSNGEIEINHNGIRKTYSLRSAKQISGNLYALSIDSTGGGLYAIVPNGEPLTIRVKFIWRLGGLNAKTLTRPSTVLTLAENSIYNYRILEYTDLGSDYALAEADQSYDYIQLTPYSQSNLYRQGVGRPTISVAGSGYTSTTTQYGVTFDSPPSKTAVVNGVQGTVDSPVTQLSIASSSGAIHPGMRITGAGAIANQYVTWVSLDRSIIQTSQAQVWSTASATLTFVGTTATGYAKANGTSITGITITDPGTGYDTAPGVTIVPGSGVQAQATVSLSGTSGTNIVKVLPLNGQDTARINIGLTSPTPYYYVFGYEGQTYKITDYKTPVQTGQAWGEIQISGYNNALATLTREMMLDPLYAGVTKNTPGSVTVQISTLRATAHDMIDVGTGGYATSKIPNDLYGPPTITPNPAQEVLEKGKGRVYYVTTDQDGNFRVGKYFAVDQGRGTVTISAPISLTGISKLSFKKGVEVDEFSKDDTMATGSLSKVPVETAIIGYIDKRLGIDKSGSVATGIIGPAVMALNGVNAMTGSLNMGSNKIINLQVPTSSSDGATKGYVDGKISLDGMDENTNDGGQDAGIMNGPLRLNADPGIITAVTTATVNIGNTVVYLNSTAGLYKGMQLNTSGFAPGAFISQINNSTAITVSAAAVGQVLNGVTVTFDPVRQGATKRYVDRSAQITKLRDVVLTSAADTDLLMFGGLLSANSNTSTPLYEASRSVINVTNNTSAITNTASSSGGGSDITVSRSNNQVTFKLVGGQGAANPITNYHVNDNAAIAQSKLNMQAAGVTPSSAGVVQASRGLAVFDQYVFTATNGWISLVDSATTTDGVAPSKLRQVGAGGALIGNTNLAAGGAMSYLSSSTVRAWLGVIDSASGGTFNGDLNVNNIFANAAGTYDIGSSGTRFRAIYGGTGSFSGNVTDNGNRVLTSVTLSAGDNIGVASSKTGADYALSVTNLGVRTIAGTANQVFVGGGSATAATTGTVTLSLPQNIHTAADVQFNKASLKYLTAVDAGSGWAVVQGTWKLDTNASFQATYADLAERYTSDVQYEPGTVLVFGGEKEVTISSVANDRRVAGVVSTNPAYNMNTSIEGVDIALQGRVPCKVVGYIKKGDLMVTSSIPGVATSNDDPKTGTIIGKALEDYNSNDVGIIEVAVGRL